MWVWIIASGVDGRETGRRGVRGLRSCFLRDGRERGEGIYERKM